MVTCPVLGRVPGVGQDDLQIKVNSSGATYLPQTRYRQRYTGSKYSAVSITGRLYLSRKELQKVIEAEGSKGKKKSGRRLSEPEKVGVMEHKDNDNLLTDLFDLSTNFQDLSTIEPEKVARSYRINKKEVRQRILGYLNTQKGKKELYFWTVTFPEKTPDDLCYQIFNIWLTSLRKYKMLRDYLWIAERQPEKTKTVHFHIAIPHRMCVQRANRMMAGTLKTFARRGVLPNFSVARCSRYNGVDIAKNRDTRQVINFATKKGSRALAFYLTKYITKNDGSFTHLAWHNSRGYSSIFTGVTFSVPEFQKYGFNYYLDRTNIKVMEFAVFIPWNNNGPPALVMDHLFKLNSYIQSQLN